MTKRRSLPVTIVALGVFLGFAESATAAENRSLAAALESVKVEELRRHIDVLADDTMEGRNVGSRGGMAAGGYIGTQLQRLKLRGGVADGGYYQAIPSGGRNIFALMPGSHPELRREVVIVGAHYDHVGYGTSSTSYGPYGFIHNGADDNASGTAGLLEIAEACTLLPTAPARTILFAWWDGEEHGLLGSKHWISQPTLARDSVVLMINADMIGRSQGGYVQVLGTRTAAGMRELVSRQNDVGLAIDFAWELEGNSDHWPFVNAGVPVLMFHTGLHGDYHRPSDDAEKINGENTGKVTKLLLATVLEAANAERLPKYRRMGLAETSESTRARFEQALAAPPGRLGVTLVEKPKPSAVLSIPGAETNGEQPAASPVHDGVEISQVIAGSAAQRAGLRVGDRILSVGEMRVSTTEELISAVWASPQKSDFSVIRRGASAPETVAVELGGNTVRVGLAWRDTDAEPGSVYVVQVVPGAPAARAGIVHGDRIYRINGQPFATSQALLTELGRASGAVELEIENRGRIRTAVLKNIPAPETAAAD